VSVLSAVAEIMLGKSSLLGDMGDYHDYSSLTEPLREKEATGMLIANKSRLEKSILYRVRYVIDRVCVWLW
jgi:hypothetical protein